MNNRERGLVIKKDSCFMVDTKCDLVKVSPYEGNVNLQVYFDEISDIINIYFDPEAAVAIGERLVSVGKRILNDEED